MNTKKRATSVAHCIQPQEAVARAEKVIAEWIETAKSLGRDIPEPQGRLAYA